MSQNHIKVLTFNCWGLKYVSKDRVKRIQALADALSTSDYDIVGLQELWVYADFQLIRNAVSKHLPFAKYLYSGALGSGLAVFSRFPILGTTIYPYALNGSPLDVAGGDFFVGKGVACITLEHPVLGELDLFNTHMYARGGDAGEEVNRAHRLVGAMQVARLVRASAAQGRYVIATGDFNSIPSSLVMTIILSHGGLTDAFASSHDSSLFETDGVHNPQHAIRDFGVTADSPLNSYSAGKGLDATAKRWQGKRLDYILSRGPTSTPEYALTCGASEVVLTGRVPGHSFSYSDHFGLEATLNICAASSISPPRNIATLPPELLHNGFASSAASIHSSTPAPALSSFPTPDFLPSAHMTTTINALTEAYRMARRRSNLQLTSFAACVIAAIGLLVGSIWQTRAEWNPLVVFLSVALGWGGTTLLYAGFIYGNYEINMLVNAIEELELLRSQRAALEATHQNRSLRRQP